MEVADREDAIAPAGGKPLEPHVERRRKSWGRFVEREPVCGVQHDRYTCEPRGCSSDEAPLGGVGVNDVEAALAADPRELDDRDQIQGRVDRPCHLLDGDDLTADVSEDGGDGLDRSAHGHLAALFLQRLDVAADHPHRAAELAAADHLEYPNRHESPDFVVI